MEHETITFKNNYGGGYVQFSREKKFIFKIHCDCPDFLNRRLKSIWDFADKKIVETPCKHLKPVVDALIKQGYTLKKQKEMKGTDKCTAELRRFLFERSDGLCECGCGRPGEEVHRKVPKTNGGKYNKENCVLLNKKCHENITFQPWHSSP